MLKSYLEQLSGDVRLSGTSLLPQEYQRENDLHSLPDMAEVATPLLPFRKERMTWRERAFRSQGALRRMSAFRNSQRETHLRESHPFSRRNLSAAALKYGPLAVAPAPALLKNDDQSLAKSSENLPTGDVSIY